MKKALIVDDDRAILRLTSRWLAKAGYSVHAAADFTAARSALDTGRPDVLVVDVRLNEFNGIQLAVGARATRPDMHIVVVSGWDDAVLRREAAACGARYLCKPLDRTELLRVLEAPGRDQRPSA